MVGVEQEPAVRLAGAAHDFALDVEAVEQRVLPAELEREPEAELRRDVAGNAQVGDRLGDRARVRTGRAHEHAAVERDGVLALLTEDAEEALALVTIGKQPAGLDADDGHRKAARAHEVEHLYGAHARLMAALEIEATQLDRVEADRLRDIERGRERR